MIDDAQSEQASDRRGPRQSLHVAHWPGDAPWRRRRGEDDAAWTSFMIYLSLPPDQRSILQAYRVHSGDGRSGQSPITWRRWSAKYRWDERAVAYERWLRERKVIDQEAKAEAAQAEWATVRDTERKRGLDVGRALIEKAEAMLRFPLATIERVTEVYEDGRTREVQVVHPGKWTFADVARLVDVGGKLVRLAAEMDTERHSVDMRVIWEEADRLAKEHGLDRNDLLAVADKIVEERWGAGSTGRGADEPWLGRDDGPA